MQRHVTAWVALLGLVTSGCSFGLSGPRPHRARDRAPACSESKGTVGLDGVVGGIATLSSFVAFEDNADEAGVILGLFGLVYTIAAVRGNSVVNACRDAKEQFAFEAGLDARASFDVDGDPGAHARNTPSVPVPMSTPTPTPTPIAASPPPVPIAASPPPTPTPKPNPTPSAKPAADDWNTFWEESP